MALLNNKFRIPYSHPDSWTSLLKRMVCPSYLWWFICWLCRCSAQLREADDGISKLGEDSILALRLFPSDAFKTDIVLVWLARALFFLSTDWGGGGDGVFLLWVGTFFFFLLSSSSFSLFFYFILPAFGFGAIPVSVIWKIHDQSGFCFFTLHCRH